MVEAEEVLVAEEMLVDALFADGIAAGQGEGLVAEEIEGVAAVKTVEFLHDYIFYYFILVLF